MRPLLAVLVLLLGCGSPVLAQSTSDFAGYLAGERSLQRHERALTNLAQAVEEWLSGRQGVEPTRQAVRTVRTELETKLNIPSSVASVVQKKQEKMVSSVERFLHQRAPDAAGQRALFESLNLATAERARALLQWRMACNRDLSRSNKSPARGRYLAWESRWLSVWKSEVNITYRLQKAFLQTQAGQPSPGPQFVRELLALQAQAEKAPAGKEFENLAALGKKRLTLLARAAEQLDRVGSGSRGALTRLRKLNKEQAELTKQLEQARLQMLAQL